MRRAILVLAAALGAVALPETEPCQQDYEKCLAAGTIEIACSCTLTACIGEDSAREAQFCYSATKGLVSATSSTSSSTKTFSTTATSTTTFSTTATSTVSIVTGTILQPPGAPQITAPAGSIPLGQPCGADEQCGPGVQCFGSTGFTIRTCGSFNAECTEDSQCATNTCSNGICSGYLPSASYLAYRSSSSSATSSSSSSSAASSTTCPSSATSTSASSEVAPVPTIPVVHGPYAPPHGSNSTTVAPTGGVPIPTGNTYGSHPAPPPSPPSPESPPSPPSPQSPPSSSFVPYTGGASFGATFSGLAALVAGIVAWAV